MSAVKDLRDRIRMAEVAVAGIAGAAKTLRESVEMLNDDLAALRAIADRLDPLEEMTKDQLLTEANRRGASVNAGMTKGALRAAIDDADDRAAYDAAERMAEVHGHVLGGAPGEHEEEATS